MKIAIVRLGALGDIVQSLIGAWLIKKYVKGAHITWFVDKSFQEVTDLCPFIDESVGINIKHLKKHFSFSGLRAELGLLKNKKFDYIIDMQGLLKSAIIARFLGRNTYGYTKHGVREKMAVFFYKTKILSPYGENVIKRYVQLIDGVFSLGADLRLALTKDPLLSPRKKDFGALFSKTKKNVICAVGASWEAKIYPPQKMAKVLKGLKANCVLIWGNEREKILAGEIAALVSSAKIAPQLGLADLSALLAQADLVIGADTGTVHMAWALNTPCVFIFGATPSFRNALASKDCLVIDAGKKINPYKLNKKDFCIRDIDENKIIKLANEVLTRSKND